MTAASPTALPGHGSHEHTGHRTGHSCGMADQNPLFTAPGNQVRATRAALVRAAAKVRLANIAWPLSR